MKKEDENQERKGKERLFFFFWFYEVLTFFSVFGTRYGYFENLSASS